MFGGVAQRVRRVACPPWIDRKDAPCARALHLATILTIFAVGLSALMFVNNVFFPIEEAGPQFYRLSVILTSTFLGLSSAAYLLLWLRVASLARPLLLLMAVISVAAYAYMLGAGSGAVVIGAVCVVFLPGLIYSAAERRERNAMIALVVAATIGMQYWVSFQPAVFTLPPDDLATLRFNVMLVGIAVGLFVIYLHNSAEKAKAAVAAEKERADGLLLNILPSDVAARLKADRSAHAARHDEVCILFADIVGFTSMSADRPAAEIVEMLNALFSRFDALCDAHDVEKIKTMGDGYFAAAGLCGKPKTGEPAVALAQFAIGMRDAMSAFQRETGEPISIRIGLHLGHAVSGVIGTRKFAFDIWGATVNMASRMESNAQPGEIALSRAYYDKITDQFEMQSRGTAMAKGVGEVDIFALIGPHTETPPLAAQ
ncbi:MAG: adenylate/guanylate cyclase domain-containing protein [Pseudomonadota bacterium]